MTLSQDHSDSGTGPSGLGLERGARWLLFGTLFAPLVVFPGFLFPFVTIRAVYFRVLVELAAAVLLYLVLRREVKLDLKRDIVLWSLAAWVAANALAAVFGVAPLRSLFGDHERMGGVWFWIHLLAYYVALRTFLRPDDWWRFFRLAVAVAVMVAGYSQYQLWIRHVDPGSTIGNTGLLALYLFASVALSVLLAVGSGKRPRLGYLAVALFLMSGIVLSGNRSATLGLVVGCGVAVVSFWQWSGSLRGWRIGVVAGAMALVAALPFAARISWGETLFTRVPAFRRLAEGVDSTRVIQWRAAAEGIRDRPLLGVGPENYQVVWNRFYYPAMYRFMGDSRWDRAHNAYLDAFATVGVIGFLALLAIWIALAWTTANSARQQAHRSAPVSSSFASLGVDSVVLGFFAGFAFSLAFWFFDFNSAMLWIALSAFMGGRAFGGPLIEIGGARERRWQTLIVLAVGGVALLALLYVHAFETLRMARALDRARNPQRSLQDVLSDYQSVFSSPAPVTQHAFLLYAGRLRDLYPRFAEIRSDPEQSALFDQAFVLALTEFERQSRQDPYNDRLLVQHSRVLMLGAYYYGNPRLYASALARLERAVAVSPRRVTTRLVLGVGYLNARRPDLALGAFQKAYSLYPPLGQSHFYLAKAYAELGKPDSAARWLRSAIARDYVPDYFLVREVAGQLANENPRTGADLSRDYLIKKSGAAFSWTFGAAEMDRNSSELATLTAELYSAAGDSTKAEVFRLGARGLCDAQVPLPTLGSVWLSRDVRESADCTEPWRVAGVS